MQRPNGVSTNPSQRSHTLIHGSPATQTPNPISSNLSSSTQDNLILSQSRLRRRQRLQCLLEIRQIIRRAFHLGPIIRVSQPAPFRTLPFQPTTTTTTTKDLEYSPPHPPPTINHKRPSNLPPTPRLLLRPPNPLVPPQLISAIHYLRIKLMPRPGLAQPPLSIQLPLLVDNDRHLPLSADLDDPFFSCGARGVRYGDAVDLGMGRGEFGEEVECLFSDCGWGGRGVRSHASREMRVEVGGTYTDRRSGGGRRGGRALGWGRGFRRTRELDCRVWGGGRLLAPFGCLFRILR